MSDLGPQDAPEPGSPRDAGRPMPPYGPEPSGSGSDSQAIVAFVLGVFSVVMLPVLGPVAIVVANRALRKVETGEIPQASRGLVVAGRVLGIIGTVLLGLGLLILVAGIVFFVTVAPGSSR